MDTIYQTTNSNRDENKDIFNTANNIADDVVKVLKDQINLFVW